MPVKYLETSLHHQPGCVIIDLRGDIDAFAGEILNAVYAKAVQENPPAVLLNFSGVGYIDSTGIALIAGLLVKIRQSQRRLLGYGLSDHYLRVFQITHLVGFIDIFPDEISALTQLNAKIGP